MAPSRPGAWWAAGSKPGATRSIYGPLIDALRRLEPLFEKAVENLRRIVPVLEADGSQERLGPVFKALLERHFPETGAIAQEIGKQLVQHKELIEPELLARLAQVVKLLAGRGPLQVKGLADVTSVLGVVQSLPLELDSRIEDADVRVDYLQNAEIACGGKVILRGRACFNSKIVARNGFEAPNATVRGGSITVTHGSVIAREIGSPSAALTEIIVGPEGVDQGGDDLSQRPVRRGAEAVPGRLAKAPFGAPSRPGDG